MTPLSRLATTVYNATLRLLGGDDFPPEAKQLAAQDLAAASDALMIPIAARYRLEQIAQAHCAVDSGVRGRVVLEIPEGTHPR
jgi:NADPH2:quinone reductase